MMTLYEIDARLAAILDFDGEYVDTESGEIVSIEDVEALGIARAEKIEGWGLWIKNQTAELEAIRAEVKSLSERAAALANKIDRSKEQYQMYLDGEKISTPRLMVSYRKAESVVLDCPVDKLPEQYQRVKTTVEPDKIGIKAALKAGEEIDGAHLVTRQSMTIK